MSEETNTGLSFEDIVAWNGKEDTGYSARMKLKRNFDKIKQALNDVGTKLTAAELVQLLHDYFLSKTADDSTPFSLTVGQLLTALNLKVTDVARIARAVIEILGTEKFVDGFFGEGYQIWKAAASEDWNFTIDRATIRKTLTVFELIIQKLRAIKGALVISPADGKIKTVEAAGTYYKLSFEDDNSYVADDYMRMQVYSGAGNKDAVRYYWVKVDHVEGNYIYVPVSEFDGVTPLVGDETVQMGNASNALRQSLIFLSATEDGTPRIELLDGVNSKNFENCLKLRVGKLDGITDSAFPSDMQPSGYGLYSNNVFLKGTFVLSSSGKDVSTLFAIMDDKIAAHMIANRTQENENILYNSSFSSDMTGWEGNNDIQILTYNNLFLMPNGLLYAFKDKVANITEVDYLSVLEITGSHIKQLNSMLQNVPTFGTTKEVSKDSSGNIITDSDGKAVDVQKKYAKNFTLTFYYRCQTAGTLHIEMQNCSQGDFEAFTPLNQDIPLAVNNEFEKKTISFEWNGTGDFLLSFTGTLYLYDMQLNWTAAMDLQSQYESSMTYTAEHLQYDFSLIKQNATNIETYKSQFELSAQQMKAEYTKMVNDLQTDYSTFKVSAQQTLSTHGTNITAAQNAANAAQSSADSAWYRADSAYSRANSAYSQATTNATAISQTQTAVSTVAARFTSSGELVNKAGIVTTAYANTMYAFNSSGNIVSFIDQTASSIRLSASQITLEGYTTVNSNFAVNADGSVMIAGKSTMLIYYGSNHYFYVNDGSIMMNMAYNSGKVASFSNSMSGTDYPTVSIQNESAGRALQVAGDSYFTGAAEFVGDVDLGTGTGKRASIRYLNMKAGYLYGDRLYNTGSVIISVNSASFALYLSYIISSPKEGDIVLVRKAGAGNLNVYGTIYDGWSNDTVSYVQLTQGSLGIFIYSTHLGTSASASGWTSNWASRFNG